MAAMPRYVARFDPVPLAQMSPEQAGDLLRRTQAFFTHLYQQEMGMLLRFYISHLPYVPEMYLKRLRQLRAQTHRDVFRVFFHQLIHVLRQESDRFMDTTYLMVWTGDPRTAEEVFLRFEHRTGMTRDRRFQGLPPMPASRDDVLRAHEGYLQVYHPDTRETRYWRFLYITDVEHASPSDVYRLSQQARFPWILVWEVYVPRGSREVVLNWIARRRAGLLLARMRAPQGKRPHIDEHLKALEELSEAAKREGVFRVRGVLAFAAETPERLEEHHQTVLNVLSGWHLLFIRPAQGALLSVNPLSHFRPIKAVFTLPPRHHVRHLTASDLAALNVAGNGPAGRVEDPEGVFWGINLENNHPVVVDLWKHDRDANHAVVLGQTGGGKTVFLLTMAFRYAAHGHRVVYIDPKGHARRLYERLGDTDTAYNPLAWEKSWSLNLLDPVYEEPDRQVDFVVRLLASLMGERSFTRTERAVLTNSLYHLYDEARRRGGTPVLEDLVSYLRSPAWARGLRDELAQAAQGLADMLQLMVLNQPTLHERFGRPTRGLHLDPDRLLTIYDLKGAPRETHLLAVLYAQILARLRQTLTRDPDPVPTLVILEELYHLRQHPMLMSFVIEMFKEFRTHRVAVWVSGQNLADFETEDDDYLLANAPHWVLFRLPPAETRKVRHLLPHLAPEVLDALHDVDPGMGLLVLRARHPVRFYNLLTPWEQEAFIGT